MVKDTVFVSDSDVPAFKELKTVQIAALLANAMVAKLICTSSLN